MLPWQIAHQPLPLVSMAEHDQCCSCYISNSSQWEEGQEGLLHLVTQGPRRTEAPPSSDTATSAWDLKVGCSSSREHGECRRVAGPQALLGGAREVFPHAQKEREPALMRPRSLAGRLSVLHLETLFHSWGPFEIRHLICLRSTKREHLTCEVVAKKRKEATYDPNRSC